MNERLMSAEYTAQSTTFDDKFSTEYTKCNAYFIWAVQHRDGWGWLQWTSAVSILEGDDVAQGPVFRFTSACREGPQHFTMW